MKKIYFIRHAKSDWKEPYSSDFERGLNKRGKGDVVKMGERLRKNRIKPDIIISSPAKRAKKTAKGVAKIVECNNIIYEISLYDSNFEKYLEIINGLDDKCENVFIVGHNFEITDVCERLSCAMIGNMPTCSIVCVGLDCDSFKDVKSKSASLLFFDFPKSNGEMKYV